jgi:hypothetical protein
MWTVLYTKVRMMIGMMIEMMINTTNGERSSPPMGGSTLRTGAKTGSVNRYNTSTTGANGLDRLIGKKDEIARAIITNVYN